MPSTYAAIQDLVKAIPLRVARASASRADELVAINGGVDVGEDRLPVALELAHFLLNACPSAQMPLDVTDLDFGRPRIDEIELGLYAANEHDVSLK